MANYILNDNGQQIVKKNKKNSSILSTDNVVVVVVDVEKNSPAEKAGFVNGDVILQVNDMPTNGMRSIYDAIGLEVGIILLSSSSSSLSSSSLLLSSLGRTISFLVKRNNKYDPIIINVTTEGERS